MSRTAWAVGRRAAPAVVLGVVVWRLGTGPFVEGLRTVNAGAVAAAAGLVAMTTVCAAWRWKIVAGGLGVDMSLSAAVTAYYRAMFLNVILPGGVAGDVHRGVACGREVSAVGRGVRSVAWERCAGAVVQLVLTAAILIALPSPVHRVVPLLVIGLAVVALGAAIVARTGACRGRSAWPRVLSRSTVREGPLARRAWWGIALASTLAVAGHAAAFLLAARTAGASAPLARMIPIAMIVLWAGVLPSVGGWGPREGLTAWAFGAAGLGAARGVASAVVYGVMVLVACLPGGAVLAVAWWRGTHRPRRPKAWLGEEAARA